jgi:hypothetical protein
MNCQLVADGERGRLSLDERDDGQFERGVKSIARHGRHRHAVSTRCRRVKAIAHAGHKVEVTGTIEESSSASSSSAAGAATSTAAMSSPRLKVDSVKMVSSTCP